MTETVFRTTYRARRPYGCDWGCGAPIEKGKSYVRQAYPPHSDPNDSDHWVTYRLHGPTLHDCPVYTPWIDDDEHPRGSDKPAEQSRVTVVTPTTGEAER